MDFGRLLDCFPWGDVSGWEFQEKIGKENAHAVRKPKPSVKPHAIDAIARSDVVTTKGLKLGARRVIMMLSRKRFLSA